MADSAASRAGDIPGCRCLPRASSHRSCARRIAYASESPSGPVTGLDDAAVVGDRVFRGGTTSKGYKCPVGKSYANEMISQAN